jgi:hypothetical protein
MTPGCVGRALACQKCQYKDWDRQRQHGAHQNRFHPRHVLRYAKGRGFASLLASGQPNFAAATAAKEFQAGCTEAACGVTAVAGTR